MGPITYSLCQKPLIGAVMWISGLCHFPPLINDTPVSLEQSGVILSTAFEVPVDQSCSLGFRFTFPSVEARLADHLVGNGRASQFCEDDTAYAFIPERERDGLGVPVPLEVVVLNQSGAVVSSKVFQALCQTSHTANAKGRRVVQLSLKRGSYAIRVRNMEEQPAFRGMSTAIHMVCGAAK